jgi:serine/threonine protein kinase
MAGQTAPASVPSNEEPLAGTADGDRSHVTPRSVDRELTTDDRRADQARLGTIVDGFRLVELLGRGGAASVYRAEHEDGRKVAVKVLHPEHGGDSRARRRLLREAYVANRIGHPNVPRVLGDGMTADDAAYLIVELCEGKTLEAKRDDPGGITCDDLVRWTDELLDVLAVAHELGIVHRDIKPQNLMITPEGQLKVLDFGIARVTDVAEVPSLVTKTGAVLGTPTFMSPEQAIGYSEEIDARADLWAVGAILFTLLTGRNVHQARSLNEAVIMAATQKAPKIRTVTTDVPVALAAVIDRALAFDREARFANARAMQDALRRAMRGDTIEAIAADSNETLPESSVRRPTKSADTPQVDTPQVDTEQPENMGMRRRKSWLLGLAVIAVVTVMALIMLQYTNVSSDVPSELKAAPEREAEPLKSATAMPPPPSAAVETTAPIASAANTPAPPKQSASGRSAAPPKASAPGSGSAPKASAPAEPLPSPTGSSSPRSTKPRMY